MRQVLVGLLVLALAVPALAGRRQPFEATESDFECLLKWPKVRRTRIFHPKPRKLRKAIRIFERGKPRRKLPKGTILQLVPTEAMVKAKGGFNKEGGGWEFFRLGVSPEGTTILERGGAEVMNRLSDPPASCQNCHAAAKTFDFVCETDHGCVELSVPDIIIEILQNSDPRCTPGQTSE
jgi:hypothetical protein